MLIEVLSHTHTYARAHARTHTHTYIHIHVHTYTRTHTHTHTHMFLATFNSFLTNHVKQMMLNRLWIEESSIDGYISSLHSASPLFLFLFLFLFILLPSNIRSTSLLTTLNRLFIYYLGTSIESAQCSRFEEHYRRTFFV